MQNSLIRKSQIKIFRNLYIENKGTTMAVSSESIAHKNLRYQMLSELFENENTIEVHDVGMGLGDFYVYLKNKYNNNRIIYSGTDILQEYVKECRNNFKECKFHKRDLSVKSVRDKYDYVVMSGVFHQRHDTTIPNWELFYQRLLKNSFSMAKKAIAFNFISPFVDFYQTHVYYCNIYKLITFINDELSRFFTIKHNYALYEFTVFVYKEDYISSQYSQNEFIKYFKNR